MVIRVVHVKISELLGYLNYLSAEGLSKGRIEHIG